MAKNWTIAEAAKEILTGNKDVISDVGKRFPIASVAIAKAGEKALDILSAFDFVTVRKVESVLKDGVQAIEDEDEIEDPVAKAEEQTEEKPKRGRKSKAEAVEEPKKRGRKKKEDSVMNEPEEDEEDDTPDYESMSEIELFKVCKAKGLKPAPKQKKQYYLDLLNPSESDDEDDWDAEEEEEKPTKTSKKGSSKKTSKKAAEDEDDDWDI